MSASTSKTEVQTNRTHGPIRAIAQSECPENPKAVASPIVEKKREVWTDIPDWKTSRSPLMEMPLEVLDEVQGRHFYLFLTEPRLWDLDLWNSKRPQGLLSPDTQEC